MLGCALKLVGPLQSRYFVLLPSISVLLPSTFFLSFAAAEQVAGRLLRRVRRRFLAGRGRRGRDGVHCRCGGHGSVQAHFRKGWQLREEVVIAALLGRVVQGHPAFGGAAAAGRLDAAILLASEGVPVLRVEGWGAC